MRVALNWLKDYVAVKMTPEQLAHRLTMSSIEVETVEDFCALYKNIVVGEVEQVRDHPNADRLGVAVVNIGRQKIQLVFGKVFAVKAGDRLPVALPGCKLPGGEVIRKTKLRGELSEGMFVADKEMAIEYSAEGLVRINPSVKPGTAIASALEIDDVVLQLDVLANRGDCMSHRGVAREIAALTKQSFKEKKYALPKISKKSSELKVTIGAGKLCPRYSALVISGLQIAESPSWLKARLVLAGMRPINNIVDITNYIMLDLGQPLHAFDYNKIAGRKMTVREAKQKEKVTTLDGVSRDLQPGMLVIEDQDRLIDLAGIMGGQNSEIDEHTSKIVLQAAVFSPLNIRKTARALGHRTEAVAAFEKGVDEEATMESLAKAYALLREACPRVALEQIIDIKSSQKKASKIVLHQDKVQKLLGIKITPEAVKKYLSSLFFQVKKKTAASLLVTVPSFRHDVTSEEDLLEEIVRLYDYENLPETLTHFADRPAKENTDYQLERKIKSILAGAGFAEVCNFSFTSEKIIKNAGLSTDDHISVLNPLSDDQGYLRTELLSGLLINGKNNLRNFSDFKLFETGNVYLPYPGHEPCVAKTIAGMVVAKANSARPIFFEAKGAVELIMKKLNIPVTVDPANDLDPAQCCYWKMYRPGRSAYVKSGDKIIGTIAEMAPAILNNFSVKAKVAFFSLSFADILAAAGHRKYYQPLSKFPSVLLDLAFVVDESILAKQIEQVIINKGGRYLTSSELFDVYRGKSLPLQKKSLAFHLVFNSFERTLVDSDIEKIKEGIVREIKEKLGGELRKF